MGKKTKKEDLKKQSPPPEDTLQQENTQATSQEGSETEVLASPIAEEKKVLEEEEIEVKALEESPKAEELPGETPAEPAAEDTEEEKTDGTFKGWLKSKRGKRILIYIGIALVVIAAIITAAFLMDASTVTLVNSNPEAGSLIGGGRKSSGTVTTIRAQANPGYSFMNWTNEDGSIASPEPAHKITVPESNITLTANWKIIEWDIELNLDGGEFAEEQVSTFTVNSDIIFLSTPVKEGQTFLGWYKDEALTQPAKDYIPTGTTENVTLYAKWAKSYLITYHLGDERASNNPDNPATYTEYANVVLENPIWYEVGESGNLTGGSYRFLGWKDKDGNKIETIVAANKADIELFADWDISKAEYYSTYTRGNTTYLTLGRYPQHILEDPRTVSELKTGIANGTLVADPLTGLYTYKNTLFAKATANPYHNEANTYHSSFSNGEDVEKGKDYFFIVEPITWRLLSGDINKEGAELLLLSEDVLTASAFKGDLTPRIFKGIPVYANNWEYSDIRAFLNETFYNEAFMEGEKTFLLTSTVDFSKKTAHFERFANGTTTDDKVFLLSYADTANTSYGWNHWTITEDARKVAKATDYAKAMGVYASLNSGDEHDAAHWWLRSSGDFEGRASVTSAIGTVGTYSVECAAIGVRPTIKIKLK